jgi:hypothetical protein
MVIRAAGQESSISRRNYIANPVRVTSNCLNAKSKERLEDEMINKLKT